MSLTVIWLFSILCIVKNVSTVYGSCNASADVYVYDIYTGTNETINNTGGREKPCLAKCCSHNQVLYLNEAGRVWCDNVKDTTYDYSDVKIYDQYKRISKMRINHFNLIYSQKFTDPISSVDIDDPILYQSSKYKTYIFEDGTLAIINANQVNESQITEAGDFCIDYQINVDGENVPAKKKLAIRLITEDTTEEDFEGLKDNKVIITSSGMLVSCVFLLLVLAVYSLLPQLRNLAGMMLMAYVATLTIAFIFRAVLGYGSENRALTSTACRYVGFIFYSTTLASFAWMNAMSFDIWWSMRGFRKLRLIHRRGILVKFGWYSIYGWGAPLVPVLFIIIVDHMDLTSTPDFVKPGMFLENQCFMIEEARLLYMNIPILITTCINIVLFTMTAYNIWRIKSDVTKHSAGESRRNKKDEMRFTIYLKLFLVMGINWILEVLSSLYYTDSVWWNIPDAFNCLSGVFIFIIFVCKRNVIVLLMKRFSIESELVRKWQPVDSVRTETTRVSRGRKMQESFTTDDFASEKKDLTCLDREDQWKRIPEQREVT